MDEEHYRYTPSLSSASAPSHTLVTDSVTCPRCKEKIPLTQALMADLEVQSKVRTEDLLRRREAELRKEAAQVVATATQQAEARTKESLATRMADLEAQVREKTDRIERATAVELQLRRHQRELEEKEKTNTLQVAREVDTARKAADASTTLRLTEEFRLREAQSREQLASMTRTIEDLKRKAEQSSQQIQGEAAEAEVELEAVLGHTFPLDQIVPVAKGLRGADIMHTVRANNGADCAVILWESKNAKEWSRKWLEKIRDDQREAKADLAVIVTNVLPVGIRDLGFVEGVWICDLAHAAVLAVALRAQLHAVQRERSVAEGRTAKEASLYDFVTGNEFQQQVIAVVTAVTRMKEDLDRERNSAARAFAKRDRQIVAVAGHIATIYGGAQGIVGASLPPVALLESADDADNEMDQAQALLSA